MMDRRRFLIAGFAALLLPGQALARTKVDLARVYGKIQVVQAFPDFKVKVVTSFPDLKVQKVTSFPDAPGKWQLVDSFPGLP